MREEVIYQVSILIVYMQTVTAVLIIVQLNFYNIGVLQGAFTS